jgi:RNA polymerase sigma-54 factor
MIKQKINQIQTQRIIMTPQLQQAVKLLQLTTLELQSLIEQELELNPVLELTEPSHQESIETPAVNSSEKELTREDETIDKSDSKAIEEINLQDFYPDDRNWESFDASEDYSEGKENFLSSIQVQSKDLNEYLISQVHFMKLDKKEMEIAESIIGNLDSDGYLRTSLSDIALNISADLITIEKILKAVQTLDPPGIAARDLRECLWLQYQFHHIENKAVAILLSEEFFNEFVNHHYQQISRKNGIRLSEIEKAAKIISEFNPKPGLQYTNAVPQYVIPDVIIRKNEGIYEIIMNDDRLPQLKISPTYINMLKNKDTIPQKDYDFVLDKFRAARSLIRNIERRRKTILDVTQEIVNTQKDFLDNGVDKLKPLKLKEIAEKLGIHESTVARVTSNKYVHTPQGTFELKYFFSQGLSTEDGAAISVRTIRTMIQELISQENPAHPLSDQTIADILNNKNINIARRTVAKYREQLKILPAHLRKNHS